jgi:hypothetical protein
MGEQAGSRDYWTLVGKVVVVAGNLFSSIAGAAAGSATAAFLSSAGVGGAGATVAAMAVGTLASKAATMALKSTSSLYRSYAEVSSKDILRQTKQSHLSIEPDLAMSSVKGMIHEKAATFVQRDLPNVIVGKILGPVAKMAAGAYPDVREAVDTYRHTRDVNRSTQVALDLLEEEEASKPRGHSRGASKSRGISKSQATKELLRSQVEQKRAFERGRSRSPGWAADLLSQTGPSAKKGGRRKSR